MSFQEIAVLIGGLIAAFASQKYLIQRAVEFIKGAFPISGRQVKLAAFLVGAFIGVLFLWVFYDLYPEMVLSVRVLIGVIFVLTAGLVASGDYDLRLRLQKG